MKYGARLRIYVLAGLCGALAASLAFPANRQDVRGTPPRPLFPKQPFAQSFYDEAFAWVDTHQPAYADDAGGIIVNHHLMARHLIASELVSVKNVHPRRVVILSPDHFSRGKTDATVTTADFDTVYGIARNDDGLADALVRSGAATADNDAMVGEHGIQGIVPLLKRQFPDASFAAIMVKSDMRDTAGLSSALKAAAKPGDLLVASIDFSHNLTGYAAYFHDRYALSVVQSMDGDGVDKVDVDCHACLKVLFDLMRARGTGRFVLHYNTNSAFLTEPDSVEESTSYVNGSFVPGDSFDDAARTTLVVARKSDKPHDVSGVLRGLDAERERRLLYGQGETLAIRPDGTQDVVCASGRRVTVRVGGADAYGEEPGHTTFTVQPRTDETVLVGVTCTSIGDSVTPFVLRQTGGRWRLVSPSDNRVYLERHFSFDGISAEILPTPQEQSYEAAHSTPGQGD